MIGPENLRDVFAALAMHANRDAQMKCCLCAPNPKMTLEAYIKLLGLNEIKVMNALQDHGGIISDCCVMACDVATENHAAAIEFLNRWARWRLK